MPVSVFVIPVTVIIAVSLQVEPEVNRGTVIQSNAESKSCSAGEPVNIDMDLPLPLASFKTEDRRAIIRGHRQIHVRGDAFGDDLDNVEAGNRSGSANGYAIGVADTEAGCHIVVAVKRAAAVRFDGRQNHVPR